LDKYKIFETNNFRQNLKDITKGTALKIEAKLLSYVYPQLRKEPHYGNNIKKLRDLEPETWRYRVGDWRFFYELDEKNKIVYMTAAYNRRESYR